MPAPNRFAAVDTGVLLALEAGDEECQEAIDGLSSAGFFCIVTETALQELADISQEDSDEESRSHAHNALGQFANFGFLAPSLTSVQMGVAEQVAQRLIEKFIPDGELNNGLILAEAAYHTCRLFITRRELLLEAQRDLLRIALVDHDLSAVVIASPAEIVAYFKSFK